MSMIHIPLHFYYLTDINLIKIISLIITYYIIYSWNQILQLIYEIIDSGGIYYPCNNIIYKKLLCGIILSHTTVHYLNLKFENNIR